MRLSPGEILKIFFYLYLQWYWISLQNIWNISHCSDEPLMVCKPPPCPQVLPLSWPALHPQWYCRHAIEWWGRGRGLLGYHTSRLSGTPGHPAVRFIRAVRSGLCKWRLYNILSKHTGFINCSLLANVINWLQLIIKNILFSIYWNRNK